MLRLRLHVPSTSLFFVRISNNEFNTVLWNWLHVVLKKSKVPLIKTVALTVRANKPPFCLQTKTTTLVRHQKNQLSLK